MQHLDEGTIHSWLDGALSADEAARVQAHVAECAQCAAAVAEARGFIAASSRILTALDHVPRSVVPAAPPVKWYNRVEWRAAATVLVVAVGSLIVVRNSERGSVAAPTTVASPVADSIKAPAIPATQPQATAAPPVATETSKLQATPSRTRNVTVSGVVSPDRPVAATATSGKSAAEASLSGQQVGISAQRNAVTRKQARDEILTAAIGANAGATPQVGGAVTTTAQSALSDRVQGVVVTDTAAREQSPLRVVGHPRLIGAMVTLYEVAPGDTVTFTEPSNLQLEAVVVTGIVTGEPQARRSAAKSAATAPTQVASPSPGAPSMQVEVTNGVTTISWPEASTGNMLRLSGHMPVGRLKEIKLRIERERAATAAKKKP
jgi:hypothetical protein